MSKYEILKDVPISTSAKYRELEEALLKMELGDCIILDLDLAKSGKEKIFIQRFFKDTKYGYVTNKREDGTYLWKVERSDPRFRPNRIKPKKEK